MVELEARARCRAALVLHLIRDLAEDLLEQAHRILGRCHLRRACVEGVLAAGKQVPNRSWGSKLRFPAVVNRASVESLASFPFSPEHTTLDPRAQRISPKHMMGYLDRDVAEGVHREMCGAIERREAPLRKVPAWHVFRALVVLQRAAVSYERHATMTSMPVGDNCPVCGLLPREATTSNLCRTFREGTSRTRAHAPTTASMTKTYVSIRVACKCKQQWNSVRMFCRRAQLAQDNQFGAVRHRRSANVAMHGGQGPEPVHVRLGVVPAAATFARRGQIRTVGAVADGNVARTRCEHNSRRICGVGNRSLWLQIWQVCRGRNWLPQTRNQTRSRTTRQKNTPRQICT